MKRVRQQEMVHESQQVLKGKDSLTAEASLREVRKFYRNKKQSRLSGSKSLYRTPIIRKNITSQQHCTRCGKEPHDRDMCPAKSAICNKCNKRGHYSNQCFLNISEVSTDPSLAVTVVRTEMALCHFHFQNELYQTLRKSKKAQARLHS